MVSISFSIIPLVVTAPVPSLIPPGFKALKIGLNGETYDLSPTTEFLLVVMCIRSKILSTFEPVRS